MLSLCQHGYEALLERELTGAGLAVTEKGAGWARSAEGDTAGLAFPSLVLPAPREFKGESVNALAAQLADFFLESLRGERIEAAWPCVFMTVPEVVGLGRRASGVEKAFDELLRKKLNAHRQAGRAGAAARCGPGEGVVRVLCGFRPGVCRARGVARRAAPDGGR
jgi:23S rRNA (cytidine2498-2'-O)-methyltransferase